MVACGTATYSDPRQFRASMAGMELGLVLTGGHAFKAQVAWADLPRLRLLSVEERAPRVAFISLSLPIAPGFQVVTSRYPCRPRMSPYSCAPSTVRRAAKRAAMFRLVNPVGGVPLFVPVVAPAAGPDSLGNLVFEQSCHA